MEALDGKSAILLSGGMDSALVAWWKRPAHALTVDYGQLPAEAEIRAAKQICKNVGIRHHVLRVDCRSLGKGLMAGKRSIPASPAPEWWPYRNQILVTFAAAYFVNTDVKKVLIGTLKGDDRYRDGSSDFIRMMNALLSYQEGSLTLIAPGIRRDMQALIRRTKMPPGLLAWCHSCYVSNRACSQCRGCMKHRETWAALNKNII